jgi:hypothetical protein
MARPLIRSGNNLRTGQSSKYDAHNTVLSKTYGALADLRRELSDSKAAVNEREDLLRSFAVCSDSQRAGCFSKIISRSFPFPKRFSQH